MPMIDNWKLVVLERYAKFDGRAGRAEYWWFALANIIVAIILIALASVSNLFFVLYFVWAIAIIVPSIAVGIRRLHDTDKTGWFLLLPIIPLVGWIILLVLMVLDSDPGPNKFGATTEPSA
jgi:uncharacterized membrane protein YhaH (DUF805 family)